MPKIKSHKETRKKALSHVLDIINLQRKKIKVIKQIELDQLTVAYSRVEFRYRNYVTKQLKTKIREYTHLFIPKTFNKESVRGEIFAEVFIDDGVLKNNQ